ncbi:hypothetical protein KM043_008146 [Ampulex compressa]|nr:hypothetical protein KM043_008146 [Ampulex compressa]
MTFVEKLREPINGGLWIPQGCRVSVSREKELVDRVNSVAAPDGPSNMVGQWWTKRGEAQRSRRGDGAPLITGEIAQNGGGRVWDVRSGWWVLLPGLRGRTPCALASLVGDHEVSCPAYLVGEPGPPRGPDRPVPWWGTLAPNPAPSLWGNGISSRPGRFADLFTRADWFAAKEGSARLGISGKVLRRA